MEVGRDLVARSTAECGSSFSTNSIHLSTAFEIIFTLLETARDILQLVQRTLLDKLAFSVASAVKKWYFPPVLLVARQQNGGFSTFLDF